ncbi:MAG: hypothetical protein KJZ54_04170 [Phycisphaerales bacterium]|nr:hypothetical protein [Phycisphaerales bacterium]
MNLTGGFGGFNQCDAHPAGHRMHLSARFDQGSMLGAPENTAALRRAR